MRTPSFFTVLSLVGLIFIGICESAGACGHCGKFPCVLSALDEGYAKLGFDVRSNGHGGFWSGAIQGMTELQRQVAANQIATQRRLDAFAAQRAAQNREFQAMIAKSEQAELQRFEREQAKADQNATEQAEIAATNQALAKREQELRNAREADRRAANDAMVKNKRWQSESAKDMLFGDADGAMRRSKSSQFQLEPYSNGKGGSFLAEPSSSKNNGYGSDAPVDKPGKKGLDGFLLEPEEPSVKSKTSKGARSSDRNADRMTDNDYLRIIKSPKAKY